MATDTTHARLIEYPWSVFEIVGLFDHKSPLVVTPLKTLANSLESEQARNFIRFQTA